MLLFVCFALTSPLSLSSLRVSVSNPLLSVYYLFVCAIVTMKRSRFGAAFRGAAQRTNARIKHDSFDTSVIEVQREDLRKFIDCLFVETASDT